MCSFGSVELCPNLCHSTRLFSSHMLLQNKGYFFTDPGFRVRVRALEDIYEVLGRASKAVQRTQALPWERQAGQDEVIQTIGDMRMALIASHKKSPSTSELLIAAKREELWPSLLKKHHLPPVAEVSKRLIPELCCSCCY